MIKKRFSLNTWLPIILISILYAACAVSPLEPLLNTTRSPLSPPGSAPVPTAKFLPSSMVAEKTPKYSNLILERVKLEDFTKQQHLSFIKAVRDTGAGIYFETAPGNKYLIQNTIIQDNKNIILINKNNKRDIKITTEAGVILAFHSEVDCPPEIAEEGGTCYDLWGLYSPDLNSFVRIGNPYQWEIELNNHGFRTGDYFGFWLALDEKWTTRDELCSSSDFNFIRAELKNKSTELGLNFSETDIEEIMERWHAYSLPNGMTYRWGNPVHPCPEFNLEYY
jgi:hypothetical protein